MAKKPFKGKYLTLENVRIHYDEINESVRMTSKDKDISDGLSFNMLLNKETIPELVLREILEKKDMMPDGYQKALPLKAVKDRAYGKTRWDNIPLGMGHGGKEINWDTARQSSLLLFGRIGSGKSTVERSIIQHCVEHSDKWIIMGTDLHQVDFRPYANYSNFIEPASNIISVAAMVRAVNELAELRYAAMSNEGVNSFLELQDAPKAIMLIIDDVLPLLTFTGIKTTEEIKKDALREEIHHALAKIAKLGKSAGIRLVVATQAVTKDIFYGEFLGNFSLRISTDTPSTKDAGFLFGPEHEEIAHKMSRIKGRGYVASFSNVDECQFYYTHLDDLHIPKERVKETGGQARIELMIKLNQALIETSMRRASIVEEDVESYEDLKNSPQPIILFIDEYSEIVEQSTKQSNSLSQNDKKVALALCSKVGEIARLGRKAGVHLLISTYADITENNSGFYTTKDEIMESFHDAHKTKDESEKP